MAASFGGDFTNANFKAVLDKAILSMTAGDTDRMLDTWVDRADFGRPSLRTVFAYYRGEIAFGALLVVFLLTTLALVWRMRHATQRNAERKMAYLVMVSHEIRTAMNALTGPLELLRREPTETQRATLLQVAQRGARGLVETVNDFLAARFADDAYLAKWPASGLPLRRWLANGLFIHARNRALQAKRRAANDMLASPADLDEIAAVRTSDHETDALVALEPDAALQGDQRTGP